jgi:hypothetical protein
LSNDSKSVKSLSIQTFFLKVPGILIDEEVRNGDDCFSQLPMGSNAPTRFADMLDQRVFHANRRRFKN